MKRTKALESTAYHEAGHAVAAQLVGVATKRLSIVPERESLGRLIHRPYFSGINPAWDSSPRAGRRIENMALVCFAGPAAQRRFNPTGWRHDHGASDFHIAVDLLSYLAGGNEALQASVNLIGARAREMVAVAANWDCIELLAGTLLERHEMSGNEVRRVIREGLR